MNAIEPPSPARRREPIFDVPGVVVALAVVFLAIYAAFDWAPDTIQDAILRDFAFAPGRLTIGLWPERAVDLLVRANSDPVARRFGSARFLVFMAVTAIASALAHWVSAPMDFAPLIGVSGSDSGLMGAAARFMFEPGAPLGPPGARRWAETEPVPAATLRGVFVDRRALIFIGVWLVTNFVFGAFAQVLGLSEAPVAWVAHLGGFFTGFLLFDLFDPPPRPLPDMAGSG
jgi:Rhomboid family